MFWILSHSGCNENSFISLELLLNLEPYRSAEFPSAISAAPRIPCCWRTVQLCSADCIDVSNLNLDLVHYSAR